MALTDKLTAIGEAIRAKTGKTDKLTLDEMPSEIASIEGGGTTPANPIIEALSVTENGTYTAPSGVDGYSPVTVNVPIPDGYIQPSGELKVTENGTHDVAAYASVNVNVAGGGGGGDIVDKSIVKYHDSTVTAIGAYVFYNCNSLTEVNVPSVTSVGAYAFSGCDSLKQFDGDKLQSIATYAFTECTALTSLTLPKVTSIAAYAFNGCGASYLSCPSLKTLSANNVFRGSKFVSVDFPVLTTLSNNAFRNQGYIERVTFPLLTSTATEAMRNCGALTYADLPLCRSMGTYTFYDCVNLETLILRKSDAICTMSNINALQNTKIASGAGHIYVPSALVDSYKAATNWSTFANQIRAIEDYPEITGG